MSGLSKKEDSDAVYEIRRNLGTETRFRVLFWFVKPMVLFWDVQFVICKNHLSRQIKEAVVFKNVELIGEV